MLPKNIPSDIDERVSFLKKCPLFSELKKEELSKIAAFLKEKKYKKNALVFKEGSFGDTLYLIKLGEVRIVKKVTEDETIVVLKRGNFFGEMALIENKPRSAGVITTEKSILYLLTKAEFKYLLSENPSIAFSMMQTLSERIREADYSFIEKLRRTERLSTIGRTASTIIHDMKNPIAIVKMFLEYLENPDLQDEKRTEYVNIINGEVDRLLDMVSSLLEYSKGKKKIKKVETSLTKLIIQVTSLLQMELKGTGIEFKTDFKYKGNVWIDPIRMRRVFFNLTDNARHAMSKGGKLTVRTEEKGDKVRVDFIDTGIGMKKEVLGKIFEPFFTSKKSGTGLGLAITQQIVKEHGGSIKMRSKEGKGTTASIYLPLKKS